MGDFSTLQEISKMYQSCKEYEQPDMTPFDFIANHLINSDGGFNIHIQGHKQKSHIPFHFHHKQTVNLYFQELSFFEFNDSTVAYKNLLVMHYFNKSIYIFNPISSVFRPPVFA